MLTFYFSIKLSFVVNIALHFFYVDILYFIFQILQVFIEITNVALFKNITKYIL